MIAISFVVLTSLGQNPMDFKTKQLELSISLLKGLPAEQFEAAKKILSLGGTVWPVSDDDPRVQSIWFAGPKFTDAELPLLSLFRGTPLSSIGCGKTRLTDEGIARMLTDFLKAKSVGVMEDHVTDAALSPLEAFNDLEDVKLQGPLLTSACLRHLAHQPNLEHLSISETAIDDRGLQYLEGLRALKWLSVDGTKITSSGLASIRNIVSLETLICYDLPIDDEGLKHLESLQKLQTLGLDGTKVTNHGMASIAKLKSLETLYVSRTAVNEQGVGLLQNMPKLKEVRIVDPDQATLEQKRFIVKFNIYLPVNRERSKELREKLERGETTIDQIIAQL